MKLHTKNITFDRKNYYYADQPQGYQLTQKFNPIASQGEFDGYKIESLVLEEESGKKIITRNKDEVIVNYDHCGSPLLTINLKHVFNNAKEIISFVEKYKKLITKLNLSKAELENRTMHIYVDVLLKENKKKTSVEIRHFKSYEEMKDAIELEVNNQLALLKANKNIINEVKKYDDKNKSLNFLFNKEDFLDYRYMTEPNIVAISLPDAYVKEVLNSK